ncbi:MAG: VWA domain-containing protein [Acidimicrobiia bacterium]
MSGFTFLSPWRLLLLGLVVVLGIVYVLFQRRRARYAVRFTNLELLESVAPRRPGWRRHVAAVVQLVALAVLIVALAQPVHDIKVPRERATVILALDVSLSMEATDVRPSRIEAAKSAAISFLDDVPPQVNVGLVTFAGSARIRVTPTTDRDAVRVAIEDVPLADGTAIGDAIDASLDALADVPPPPTAPPCRPPSCCCPTAAPPRARPTPSPRRTRSTPAYRSRRSPSAHRTERSPSATGRW